MSTRNRESLNLIFLDPLAANRANVGYTTGMDTTYLSPGNAKTECVSFDLPAKITCPGMTSACGDKCYAASLMRIYSGVAAKYARNLEFSNDPGFVRYMIRTIPRCEFRIHVSGDFHSAAYVKKWIEICKKRQDVIFYTYTRSWKLKRLWKHLEVLGDLPNVTLNLSVDKDTGQPTFDGAENYRWCYLTHDDTVDTWMRPTDIVFRSNATAKKGNHKWKRKDAVAKGLDPNEVAPILHRISGAIVCPFERGADLPGHFSCAKCHLCVVKPKVAALC